jgi:large conductance mechanosensitive channel
MGILKEFKEFLKEYKVMGIAVGIVMGLATVALVNSLVSKIIMPIITPFIPGGAWETATLTIGPVVLSWGAFLGAVINFVIIAFVIFIIAKKFMKEEKVTKK